MFALELYDTSTWSASAFRFIKPICASSLHSQVRLLHHIIHACQHQRWGTCCVFSSIQGNILVRLEPPPKLTLLGIAYRCLGALNGLLPLSPVPRARLEALRKAWLQPSLVLLDVGMATELSARDQENMVGLFRSFAAMDGRACGLWTLRFSGELGGGVGWCYWRRAYGGVPTAAHRS